jgi:hypothetical protein
MSESTQSTQSTTNEKEEKEKEKEEKEEKEKEKKEEKEKENVVVFDPLDMSIPIKIIQNQCPVDMTSPFALNVCLPADILDKLTNWVKNDAKNCRFCNNNVKQVWSFVDLKTKKLVCSLVTPNDGFKEPQIDQLAKILDEYKYDSSHVQKLVYLHPDNVHCSNSSSQYVHAAISKSNTDFKRNFKFPHGITTVTSFNNLLWSGQVLFTTRIKFFKKLQELLIKKSTNELKTMQSELKEGDGTINEDGAAIRTAYFLSSKNQTLEKALENVNALLTTEISNGHVYSKSIDWIKSFWQDFKSSTCDYQLVLKYILKTHAVSTFGTNQWEFPLNGQATTVLKGMVAEDVKNHFKTILNPVTHCIKQVEATDRQCNQTFKTLTDDLTTRFLLLDEISQKDEKAYPDVIKLAPESKESKSFKETTLVDISMMDLIAKIESTQNCTLYAYTNPGNFCQITVPNKNMAPFCKNCPIYWTFQNGDVDFSYFGLKSNQWHPVSALIYLKKCGWCFSLSNCKYRMTEDNHLGSGMFGSNLDQEYTSMHSRTLDTHRRTFSNLIKPKESDVILSGVGYTWNAQNMSSFTPFTVVLETETQTVFYSIGSQHLDKPDA